MEIVVVYLKGVFQVDSLFILLGFLSKLNSVRAGRSPNSLTHSGSGSLCVANGVDRSVKLFRVMQGIAVKFYPMD